MTSLPALTSLQLNPRHDGADCLSSRLPFWYPSGVLPNARPLSIYRSLNRICNAPENGGLWRANMGGRCDYDLEDPARYFLDQRIADLDLYHDASLRAWCMAFCWCMGQDQPSAIPDDTGFIRANGVSWDVVGLNVRNHGLMEIHQDAASGQRYTRTLQEPQPTSRRQRGPGSSSGAGSRVQTMGRDRCGTREQCGERFRCEDDEGGWGCSCCALGYNRDTRRFDSAECVALNIGWAGLLRRRDGRIEEGVGCPCNKSYVSTACCLAGRDGMVWEEQRLKLGELAEGEGL